MKETTILDVARQHSKAKKDGVFEVEALLNSTGWAEFIKPEFEKLIKYYNTLLTEATLSNKDVVCIDPLTGHEQAVSPVIAAARIEGVRFALNLLESKLKQANKARINVS